MKKNYSYTRRLGWFSQIKCWTDVKVYILLFHLHKILKQEKVIYIRLLYIIYIRSQDNGYTWGGSDWKGPWGDFCKSANFLFLHLGSGCMYALTLWKFIKWSTCDIWTFICLLYLNRIYAHIQTHMHTQKSAPQVEDLYWGVKCKS